MEIIKSISKLPKISAVYAMYGGNERSLYVAYVGIAGNLRQRINQHLILRDSSIATGTSAVHLNPDFITEVRFWTLPEFSDDQTREAAELIAFEILNPVLRSRGGVTGRAKELCNDETFCTRMKDLFSSVPNGKLILPSLQNALQRIDDLENRISLLEEKQK